MIILQVTQAATAKEPITVNTDTVLEPDGERLASASWLGDSGITLGTGAYGPAISPDLRKSTFWVVGGTPGQHLVTGTLTTDHVPPRIHTFEILVTLV